MDLRQQRLYKALSILETASNHLQDTIIPCRIGADPITCRAHRLEAFTTGLRSQGLLPIPSPLEWKGSIAELLDRIKQAETTMKHVIDQVALDVGRGGQQHNIWSTFYPTGTHAACIVRDEFYDVVAAEVKELDDEFQLSREELHHFEERAAEMRPALVQ